MFCEQNLLNLPPAFWIFNALLPEENSHRQLAFMFLLCPPLFSRYQSHMWGCRPGGIQVRNTYRAIPNRAVWGCQDGEVRALIYRCTIRLGLVLKISLNLIHLPHMHSLLHFILASISFEDSQLDRACANSFCEDGTIGSWACCGRGFKSSLFFLWLKDTYLYH